jgi:hypothetical protein
LHRAAGYNDGLAEDFPLELPTLTLVCHFTSEIIYLAFLYKTRVVISPRNSASSRP